MFKLAIVFTLAMQGGEVSTIRFDYDYQFHSETGCYLAGRFELEDAVTQGFLEGTPVNTRVEIECDNGAT